jgi:two-component system, OmpR family, response regulator
MAPLRKASRASRYELLSELHDQIALLDQICRPWTRRHIAVNASRLRVLVVDDNVDAAQALAAYLESDEMECRPAYGGVEAVKIGTDWRPHVIVMDISMLRCNGFEAALALRRDERPRGMAIIAFTALDETEVVGISPTRSSTVTARRGTDQLI